MNEPERLIENSEGNKSARGIIIYLNQIHLTRDSVQIQGLIVRFEEHDFSLYTIIGDQKFDARLTGLQNREIKTPGNVIHASHAFTLEFPIRKLPLEFSLLLQTGVTCNPVSNFLSTNQSQYNALNHWFFVDHGYLMRKKPGKPHVFVIQKYSWLTHLMMTLQYIIEAYSNITAGHSGLKKLPFLFFAVWFCYPVLNKERIWLFMDRKNIGDDSGFFLFEYAAKQKSAIQMYYVLEENEEFRLLKKSRLHMVAYGSLKHRLLTACAELVISSHFGEFTYDPFSIGQQLSAPLLKAKRVFLDHGVIKDDVSDLIRRDVYYFSTVIASTEPEFESLLGENYGYDPGTVQLLGLSRFDRLGWIDTERIVLFSPTWRDSIITPGPDGTFPYVEDFDQTEYFRWTSDILLHPKIEALMRAYQYTFVFKPHPGVLNQLPHYKLNKNSSIRISLPDEKYSEMSSKAALLITDYSSVAFNFAYQKKPVIYYQCEPTHLKKSYFDYEHDGFGEVVKTIDGLLDVLASYLRNECKMKSEYEKRVLQTFPYVDRKNCERTYQYLRSRYG